MFTKSIWNAYAQIATYPVLQKDIEVDTAIIGGGITGLATVLELAAKGQRVAVLEARKMGGGTTSHSTGNLYCTTASGLDKLREKYDTDTVSKVLQGRQEAMEKIAAYINQYGIDCDFERQPWYLYATEEFKTRVEKQYEAAQNAGLAIEMAAAAEIPVSHAVAIKLPNQIQLNPMRFVQGLAAIAAQQCQLYECTKVEEVKSNNGQHQLITSNGTITAKHVVHATHTPKGIKLWHTLLGPYREYGIACTLNDPNTKDGIFWGYYDSGEEKFSTRTYTQNGQRYLLVIGKPHKVGQLEANTTSINQLEAFAREHFNVGEVVYRWGGQHYRPADLLPYIGEDGNGTGIYIATGFSTDGLVWGVLAARIIADLITGSDNPWADMYKPTRNNMAKSAKEFVKENLNVAGTLLKDYLAPYDAELVKIAPGMGDVLEIDGDKIAVYKHESGKTSLCSAVCPHMGCIVHFNQAEQTWDCPCHGSRFAIDGSVLEGPAFDGLKQIEPKKE